MPAPVPLAIRQALWTRNQQGASTAELAAAFDLAPRTVRGVLQRGRQNGLEDLAPNRPGPDAAREPEHPARSPALHLRQQHPGWGAGLIRVMLQLQRIEPLPAERTLQRWFTRAGLGPAPPGRRPEAANRRATRPHETWQVDAAEEIRLADDTRVSWLRIADEFTGAVLSTVIFPPRALERGACGRDPEVPAGSVLPLGTPHAHPGRQRHALGLGRRSAHRIGPLALRTGRRGCVESTTAATGQRRGRAKPGHREAVGRAAHL